MGFEKVHRPAYPSWIGATHRCYTSQKKLLANQLIFYFFRLSVYNQQLLLCLLKPNLTVLPFFLFLLFWSLKKPHCKTENWNPPKQKKTKQMVSDCSSPEGTKKKGYCALLYSSFFTSLSLKRGGGCDCLYSWGAIKNQRALYTEQRIFISTYVMVYVLSTKPQKKNRISDAFDFSRNRIEKFQEKTISLFRAYLATTSSLKLALITTTFSFST